jgi:hypothetical protein
MTEEERRIITGFVERVAGVAPVEAPRTSTPWGASVPATQARPALPPVDREADQLIAELFARHPEARYRLTQTAFVQEAALAQAQNRIQELEWELENAHGQVQAAQQPRGMFGGLFGGGGARPQGPMRPRPQPVAPPYNPAMLQQGRGGPGFLGTALMTAAGVAGGLVLGNMIMGMLDGGGAAEAASTGGGFGQEAVPASSPWTDPAGTQDAAPAGSDWGAQPDDAVAYDDGAGFDEDI